jgi:hypothetical protein
MSVKDLDLKIEAEGTGWLPGGAHRSGWEACPECKSEDLENGSYVTEEAVYIVTRCRNCGNKHTLTWVE